MSMIKNFFLRFSRITQSPLPKVIDLLRIIFMLTPSIAQLSFSWRKSGEIVYWFSRTAWSLSVVAQWRQRISNVSSVTIWIPEYFCNESLAVLREMDVQLVFYPIDEYTQPSIKNFPIVTDENRPDIFLLVHYFGEPVSNTEAVVDFCSEHGAWLVEDAAHVLQPVPGVGESGDCVLFSPHKLLSIPDGAIFVVRKNGPSMFVQQPESLLLLDDIVKDLIPRQRRIDLNTLTWMFKRTLQKVGVRIHHRFPEFTYEPIDASIKEPAGMTNLSKCLLLFETSKLTEYAQHRKNIVVEWEKIFQSVFDAKDYEFISTSQTPYLACIQMKDHTSAESIYRLLHMSGVPVSTWPDLPPEVLENGQTYVNQLRSTRVYLPVHQTVSKPQLNHVCKRLRDLSLLGWHLQPITSQDKWSTFWLDCKRKSLPQTWEYGAAKAMAEGWQVKRLLVTNEKNDPIALFQILVKGFSIFGGIARINRGPLMLCSELDNENHLALQAISVLTREMKRQQWLMLQIAPLLPPNIQVETTLRNLGYHRQKNCPMDSAVLLLEGNEEALLMSFNGKWRNTLRKGQKFGMIVKKDEGAHEHFQWLLDFYHKQQHEKKFKGTSERVLHAMKDNQSNDFKFNLYLAFDGEEINEFTLMGVLVSLQFGEFSEYLIGATNEKGRKMQVNSVLLWEAIRDAKRNDCKWFDVGGLAENTPKGIAKFKKGINPTPYNLTGEWRKWF
jgi:lipid II:glycine glycyltransferase (peptidoglycan interpeptide bridge formation enzyme)